MSGSLFTSQKRLGFVSKFWDGLKTWCKSILPKQSLPPHVELDNESDASEYEETIDENGNNPRNRDWEDYYERFLGPLEETDDESSTEPSFKFQDYWIEAMNSVIEPGPINQPRITLMQELEPINAPTNSAYYGSEVDHYNPRPDTSSFCERNISIQTNNFSHWNDGETENV